MILSIGGMLYLMEIFIGLENKERGQIFFFFFLTKAKSKHVCPLSYNGCKYETAGIKCETLSADYK